MSRDKNVVKDIMLVTFSYKRDKVESWDILRDGTSRKGDCEDFALTTLWLLADKSMVKFWWYLVSFQAVIWYVKAAGSGEGHAELWFRGEWIDNIHPTWSDKAQNKKVFPYLFPLVIYKFITRGWPTWLVALPVLLLSAALFYFT